MYNVGFGDCFLLTLPQDSNGQKHRVLIDCGSIKGNGRTSLDDIVERVIADVTENGTPHIDVVVMSHRHRDHIKGFGNPLWDEVKVDEVWMPWTEGPDTSARDLRLRMIAFGSALQEEFRALQAVDAVSDRRSSAIQHVLDNSLFVTNDEAMATLHRGFVNGTQGARRMFLSSEDKLIRSPRLPGVDVHVLGPSKDPGVIGRMDPPNTESFFRAAAGIETSAELLPFPEWVPDSPTEPSDELKSKLRDLTDESALIAAVAFENALNNTSLFLAFEIGRSVLVFPGDSQWGSWDATLDDRDGSALLARTRFYKTGHHGSHNSTPVSFVELLGDDFWAATSVIPHGSFAEIPRDPLLEHLRDKLRKAGNDETRVVRSDEPPDPAPVGVKVVDHDRIDFAIPID